VSYFEELKRRNVIRVGIAYVVACWLILQVADVVLDNTPAPDWVMQLLMALMALGFPLAVLFAWAFELTPEGIKRERDVDRNESITRQTGRKLDRAIIAVLVVALGYFVWESRFSSEPDQEAGPDTAAIAGDHASSDESGSQTPPRGDTAEPPEKSIAVLPFVNLSSDPEQEFFSDGISEELLNVLAQYPGLRVAARTSSFQFKGQNRDIGEIARLLKVKNVLEGSVRKSGTRLRITAQLIEADTGYHLWSETYDRELNDVFAIQDEISVAIGEAMRTELALRDGSKLDAPRVAESSNTAAYEAFLRGRHLVNQRGKSNILQAVEDLKRAVRLDPEFAPAQAWMAIAWIMMLDSPATYGDLTLAEVRSRATPHIEKALSLNPDLAEAYGARGLMEMNASDYAAALENLEHALELNPVYIDAMNWSQISSANFGNYSQSLAIQKQIVEIDPLTIVGRLNYAPALARTDLEAGRQMAHSLAEQNAWAGYTAIGNIELYSGKGMPEALGWFMKAYGTDPHDEFTNRFIIRVLSLVGEYEEARRISDGNLFLVDLQQGDLEGAVHTLRQMHEADPQNYAPLADLADALHLAHRFEESKAYYLQLQKLSPTGLIVDSLDASSQPTVRLAYDHKLAGDEQASLAAISLHRQDLEKRARLGLIFASDFAAEAMSQAVEGDYQGAFESIRSAIDLGLRNNRFFLEPCFEPMAQHPEFLALKAEVKTLVEQDHREIVQMICQQNPIPDMWQPLAATCADVSASTTL
jgi:TolB-like protein